VIDEDEELIILMMVPLWQTRKENICSETWWGQNWSCAGWRA
jgi:hypothetical protein